MLLSPEGTKDSSSRVMLEPVDLVSLQPCLIKKNEAQVTRGTLDLNLASESQQQSGRQRQIVLQDLELARAGGYFDTLMGLPRNAVIIFPRIIATPWTSIYAERQYEYPSFSLNENLSTRIAIPGKHQERRRKDLARSAASAQRAPAA